MLLLWVLVEFCPVPWQSSSQFQSRVLYSLHSFSHKPTDSLSVLCCPGLRGGMVETMQDCLSYPFECHFPWYYAQTRYCDHSTNFMVPRKVHGQLFNMVFLWGGWSLEGSTWPTCSAFSNNVYLRPFMAAFVIVARNENNLNIPNRGLINT